MIPDGWSSAPVAEIADLVAGGTPSTGVAEYWDGDIPWCTPTDITSTEGKTLYQTDRRITQAGLAASAANLLPEGSLLLCTRATVGDIRIAGQPTATNQGFKSLVVKLPNDNVYVYYQLATLRNRLLELSSGSTFLELSKKDLARVELLVPPPVEQQAIAEALSDADALVESLDEMIAKTRDMKLAAMQQLLTGRTRLLGGSTEWGFVKVGEIARTLKGRGLSRDAVLATGAHPCLLYGELFTTYKRVARGVGGRTNSLDGEPSKFGDVLMPGSTTTSGEDLATATALLMDGVRLGGDVNIIRPDLQRIDSRWMAYVFTHCHKKDVALRAQGVTIHHLYGRDIASIEMRLPERDEQTRLADVLEDMDAEIDALVAQREKAELVKQGMMQALLSGKVRLA